MIKRTIGATPVGGPADREWLRLEDVADVEITSESPEHPVEAALDGRGGEGWRAGGPGEQTIRVLFHEPRPVRRVRLVFEERETSRTQEFVLRAVTPGGLSRELVRQQFNFSPQGAMREEEEYRFELPAVAVLELTIRPDIGGGAHASLKEFRAA